MLTNDHDPLKSDDAERLRHRAVIAAKAAVAALRVEGGPDAHILKKPSTDKPLSPTERQDESIERPLKGRGAGAIFYIRATDQFMFFLRDDKESIPFPDMVDIIGGHMDEGETPEETAQREFAEELDDLDTGQPFQAPQLVHFKTYIDGRNVEQNIFGCVLEEVPNLHLKEGQRLVFLDRDEIGETDFAFHYKDIILEFVESTK